VSARRLGQDEQYLTVREILSEASTLADGALSRERSDYYRFGYAMLGFTDHTHFSLQLLATGLHLAQLIKVRPELLESTSRKCSSHLPHQLQEIPQIVNGIEPIGQNFLGHKQMT